MPATARRVVTDGTTSAAIWVADKEWAVTCNSRGDCVTQEMVDAFAERFLRRGAEQRHLRLGYHRLRGAVGPA